MVDSTKYVVLDVETNGLLYGADDLLSISFYRPDNGFKYERYLPLELNKKLNEESSKINGITYDMIKDKKPLSQREWDQLVEQLDLDNREILHFGKIDPKFLGNYFFRHKLNGFTALKFHNIKRHFITHSFSSGEYSKDNLCRGFGIEGIREVHNGLNDCILEWKLFEKTGGGFVFCPRLGNGEIGLFELTPEYFVPASAIRYYTNLKYAINLPKLKVDYEEIYSLKLSDKCQNRRNLFFQPAGYASEKLIKSMLCAKNAEDVTFAKENFKKLKFLGKFSFVSDTREIFVAEKDDGTLTAVKDEDKEFVEEMNRTMLNIKAELPPLINFIKKEIFNSDEVLTQETMVCNELHAFGYTDFSNQKACLEMKFSDSLMDDYYFSKYHQQLNKHKYQFYILSGNRPTFLLIGGHSRFIILKLKFYIGEESVKEAIAAHRRSKAIPVIQYSQDGKKIKEFASDEDAAIELGCSKKAIKENCNGRTKLTRGFQFKYKGTAKKIDKLNRK